MILLLAVVVPSDHEVCREYGKLKAKLREAGIVVADNDLGGGRHDGGPDGVTLNGNALQKQRDLPYESRA